MFRRRQWDDKVMQDLTFTYERNLFVCENGRKKCLIVHNFYFQHWKEEVMHEGNKC